MGMDMIHNVIVKQNNNKYIGSCCGNSFVMLDCRDIELNKQFKSNFASRNIVKYGVDSALFLERSEKFDFFMSIFEKNGTESESCGNGAILISNLLGIDKGKIETKSGIVRIENNLTKQAILMDMELSDIKEINGKKNCLFVKFGEPHIIYLVDDFKGFDLIKTAENLQKKYPEGVNVDVIKKNE